MVLNKLKDVRKKERGFTIVELLIVIVVIGILAGITIVAYSGITAKANATKAQTNAAALQKVLEAYNADNASYPATIANITGYDDTTRMPAGVTVIADASTPAITASNGLTSVAYSCLTSCTSSTGGRVAWWDFSKSSSQLTYIYVGAATSSGTFVYPAAS